MKRRSRLLVSIGLILNSYQWSRARTSLLFLNEVVRSEYDENTRQARVYSKKAHAEEFTFLVYAAITREVNHSQGFICRQHFLN